MSCMKHGLLYYDSEENRRNMRGFQIEYDDKTWTVVSDEDMPDGERQLNIKHNDGEAVEKKIQIINL